MKKFDTAMICVALAVLILAFIFYPAKKINFTRTTLVFSQWLKEDMPQDAINAVIAEFEEANPSINIILEDRTREKAKSDCALYREAARNAIQNNEGGGKKNNGRRLPDIILVDPLWLDDSEKEIMFEKQDVSGTPVLPGAPAAPDVSGAADYALTAPLYSYFNALFYNTGILEEAGFDRPPKTRSGFEEFCQKLKGKGIYGLSVSGNFFTDIFPWICQNPYPTDGEKDIFDFTGKNSVETIDFFSRLSINSMLGRPPFITGEDEKIKAFTSGKTAMITASSKLIRYFKSLYGGGFRFQITNIPYSENYAARPALTMNSVHVAVLSAGEHREEALKFTGFLADKRTALAGAAGAIPANGASALFSSGLTPQYNADPLYAKAKNLIENADTVDGWKMFSACASLEAIAAEEMSSMFNRRQTAAEAAGAVQRRYAGVVR
jgi:multiple sugar transport system substrate-binding protein